MSPGDSTGREEPAADQRRDSGPGDSGSGDRSESSADRGDGEAGPIPDYGAKYQPEDPESKYPDPAEELPNVPEPPRPDPDEVPAGLRASFWWLVLVFNAALAALWVGLLFVVFEGNLDLGGRLLFAGAVLFAYGFYRYRVTSRKYME